MQKKSVKELKGLGTDIKATIHVGKEGLTESVVEEVKNQIKAHKLVKVKVLAPSVEIKKEIAKDLEERTGAALIEVRGNTILLCDARLLERKGAST
jgi:RNA-binding protein